MLDGGHIDKYIGDSIMAVWGIGARSDSQSLSAVRAAVEMRGALERLNQSRIQRGLFELRVGIGIHAGHTVAGVVGSKHRKDYTVIGDAVNSAARIQDQTKIAGFDVLIGEPVLLSCRDFIWTIPCGAIELRGRKEKINLYKLVAVADHDGTPQFGDPKLAIAFKALNGKAPGVLVDSHDNPLHWPDHDLEKRSA